MKSQKNSSGRSQSQSNSQTNTNTSPQNLIKKINEFYLCTDGVYKNKSQSLIKICGYLDVKALCRDGESSDWKKLIEFKDVDGFTHQQQISEVVFLGQHKDILGPLVKDGLQVINSVDTVNYIKTVTPQDRVRIVYKIGWHTFNSLDYFVLPDGQIPHNALEHIILDPSVTAPTIGCKGTLKEWQDHIAKPAVSSSRSILSICAAFAAPLVSLGHRANAGFHLRGNSSSGKSVAQAIGCSVIGSPNYKQSWKSTANGLEGIALAYNDLMLPLDEISQADPTSVCTSIYDLMNGKQKIRANKSGLVSKTIMNWFLLVLSSGEESLRDIAMKQGRRVKAGEEIRLADIPADAGNELGVNEFLPKGFTSIQDYGTAMKNAVHQYYGTAFQAWLTLLAGYKHDDIPTDLATEINTFVTEVAPKGTSQVKRVAESFGLLAVAGELASENDITGWAKGVAWKGVKTCFEAWHREFGDGLPKEEQEIINRALNVLTKNQSCFIDLHREQVPDVHIGWIDSSKSGNQEFYVYRQAYVEHFCMGKSSRLVDQILKKAGILLEVGMSINPRSRNKDTVKVRKMIIPDEK